MLDKDDKSNYCVKCISIVVYERQQALVILKKKDVELAIDKILNLKTVINNSFDKYNTLELRNFKEHLSSMEIYLNNFYRDMR